jgi:CRISPR-associated endonuclease/helicase Cas3
MFSDYFSELYWKAKSLDAKGIMKLLKPDDTNLALGFRSAAGAFKLIDDSAQRAILVRYGEGGKLIDLLKMASKSDRTFEIKLLRKLQRYTVNIYTNQFAALHNRGSLEEIIPGVFAIKCGVEYNEEVGLLIDDIPYNSPSYMSLGNQ